jgi:hypothetical protein
VPLLVIVGLAAFLIRYCCSASSKAKRRERRAARRAAFETRRAAFRERRAARMAGNHVPSFWQRVLSRGSEPGSKDYEEKRALVLQQEDVLEERMRCEIDRLHRVSAVEALEATHAQEMGVIDLEAQRFIAPPIIAPLRCQGLGAAHEMSAIMTPVQELPNANLRGGYASSTYSDPPPDYETNDGRSDLDLVVDGFQYTPDLTPEHSDAESARKRASSASSVSDGSSIISTWTNDSKDSHSSDV